MKPKTKFNFVLPKEIVDKDRSQKKARGVMRLIKVKDLIEINHDTRVKENSSYFYVVLLSKVVKFDFKESVPFNIIKSLPKENFIFLIDLLDDINHKSLNSVKLYCNNCKKEYRGELNLAGVV